MKATKNAIKKGMLYGSLLIASCAFLIPFTVPRCGNSKNACINNLRQIDGAKEQWALENKKMSGYQLSKADEAGICEFLKGGLPRCPQGGKYSLNAVDKSPTCSKKDLGHSID